MDRSTTIKAALIIFAISLGVRILVWQNNTVAMDGVQYMVTSMYQGDAETLLRGDVKTFLQGPDPPSNATILAHPPGYPLFMAAVDGLFGGSGAFRLLQIIACAFGAVAAFLLASELFDPATSVAAGLLVAFSPQLAYYSGILLPDGICTVPVVLAVYFFARAVKDPRLVFAVLCGLLIGVSCWLRSNAMLLPLFFCIAALMVLPRTIKLHFAGVLMLSFVVSIAPITIRNAAVFHSFIPLSLGMGHMIVIGLADYDTEGRLGLPKTDEAETQLDATRDERPDYYGSLYEPDGVRRERERAAIGMAAIRANFPWYLSVVGRRGLSMLRMERVPVIDREYEERDTTAPLLFYLNVPLKFVQKLFITAVILPLFIAGLAILVWKKNYRTAMILLIVPLYYICTQSLIYSEYRFVVSMVYFILILSAVPIGILAQKLGGLLHPKGSNLIVPDNV